MASGALQSAVRVSFRPTDSKFLTLQTGDVMVKAMMCHGCGAIELVGDVAKLRRLLGEAVASPSVRATTVKTPEGET
jgi:hypothetical protein